MTKDTHTIAALLTPLAPGAIAVIGLTGPDVDAILNRILRRPGADLQQEIAEDQPTFCRLEDRGEILDDAVVVRTRRGNVMTAELNTHGGVRIAQRTLLLLEKHGAEIVAADVFASRFTTAEAVEQDVDWILLGVSSRRLTRWLLNQRRVLPDYLRRLDSLAPNEADAFHERSRIAIRLIQGLRVALIGPPNSGKSTLANRLIGTDRVITSDEAGTTRDWVSETALIRGWPVTLTDTAGIHDTDCSIEGEAIRRARRQAGLADLVVVVLDATSPPDRQQVELEAIRHAIPADRPCFVVHNKCDVATADCGLELGDWGSRIVKAGDTSPAHVQRISALTGAGIDAMESQLESMLGLDRLDNATPTAFLSHQLARSDHANMP